MNLHNLYEPTPVTFSFETPGWYILAGIILVFSILVIFLRIRKFIKNTYRRKALRELASLENATEGFPQLFVVLKQTAILAFGRDQVAPLYGEEWLRFLEKTGTDVQLSDFHRQIGHAMYAGEDLEPETQKAIFMNAEKWIRTHAG